jgi:SAM-dependent methyltransferase
MRRAVRRLPSPRDEAALALLRATRDLVTGRQPATVRAVAEPKRGAELGYSLVLGPKLPKASPVPELDEWKVPPLSSATGKYVNRGYDTGQRPTRFDVELLERLNAEYASKPIVPAPRSYEAEPMARASLRRVRWVHRHVDLADKKVLEIGCGNGYEVWTMAHNLGCDAYGVDVNELGPWADLTGDRAHFVQADLTQQRPFGYGTFDRIVSFTVWEHVTHPYALLDETWKLLKPGGLAWIQANLFAGPKASHRYREIYFPWPHLLFPDDVVRDWDAKHGRTPRGLSWVNRLSWEHYARKIAELGFRVRRLDFSEIPWDEEFYRRFEDVLGRYPAHDLSKDFFTVVLEKPLDATT